jgi:23S rRNA pseudouridine2605 synthase
MLKEVFKKLGYKIIFSDRVVFAHLTKKDLPRGNWRYLNSKEINFLKMI